MKTNHTHLAVIICSRANINVWVWINVGGVEYGASCLLERRRFFLLYFLAIPEIDANVTNKNKQREPFNNKNTADCIFLKSNEGMAHISINFSLPLSLIRGGTEGLLCAVIFLQVTLVCSTRWANEQAREARHEAGSPFLDSPGNSGGPRTQILYFIIW